MRGIISKMPDGNFPTAAAGVKGMPHSNEVEQCATAESNNSSEPSTILFSLHGIKTRGRWQKDVTPILGQAGFTVVPLDYGYFWALQLLSHRARRKKVDWFRDEYSRQCDRLRCDRPSI